jgi:RNA-directed DNA polymerase
VRSHFLRVLERAAVREVGGDPGGAERVATDFGRDAGRFGATADHAPGVGLVHGAVGQRIGFVAARGAEQPALAVPGDAGRVDALDALIVGISSRKVNFILDADIRSFFTEVSQQWVVRFLEHRIGDMRILRLVQKWLRAGVLEDGIVTIEEKGTGQGSVISPLLANVYLHYVFDLWAERWRRREATGDMIMVRYADDLVVGFQHENDARRFWDAMRERLREFSLSLHPDKTRLIAFGRHAAQNCKKRGLAKPETFTFLGFVFICGKSRRGDFQLRRKSRRDRMRTKLREIKEALRQRMHRPIPETGKWLGQIVAGYFAYHAVPTNSAAIAAFRYHVTILWHRRLCRRSQKARLVWTQMVKLADAFLPKPRVLHPWPSVRFAVRHAR